MEDFSYQDHNGSNQNMFDLQIKSNQYEIEQLANVWNDVDGSRDMDI